MYFMYRLYNVKVKQTFLAVKAPSPPFNLTLISMRWNSLADKLTPMISWQPPRSDLPLKDYQVNILLLVFLKKNLIFSYHGGKHLHYLKIFLTTILSIFQNKDVLIRNVRIVIHL